MSAGPLLGSQRLCSSFQVRIGRAGAPTAIVRGGIAPVTTALAPMTLPSPIEAPPRTATPSPSQTLRPMWTDLLFESRRVAGRPSGLLCGESCAPP